jgi:hypothetical protein
MDDNEIIEEAEAAGWSLVERIVRGEWVWGWARGDDERWPCYCERRLAVSWMQDRLVRERVFV